eukprot:scaffold3254_cov273-Prasinococcus_capsulatus_cf.AAC.3
MSTDTDGATAAVADADASASTASNGDATGPQQQQQQPSSAPQPRPLGEDGKSVQWMDRVGQEIATVIEFENRYRPPEMPGARMPAAASFLSDGARRAWVLWVLSASLLVRARSDDEGPEGEPPRKAPSCSCTIC